MGTRKMALTGQLADADIRLLRVFIAVVEAGGFSAAEIQLNLANSTISNYIADLERRLQMKLCQRGRAGFAITDQGRLVFEAAQQLVGALEGFRDTINQAHNKLLGSLRLGFAEHMLSVYDTSVVQTLMAFSDIAPEVEVQISTLSSDDVATAVLEGKVDVGITVLPHSFPELASQDLFSEYMQLYCGEGHPLFDRQVAAAQDGHIARRPAGTVAAARTGNPRQHGNTTGDQAPGAFSLELLQCHGFLIAEFAPLLVGPNHLTVKGAVIFLHGVYKQLVALANNAYTLQHRIIFRGRRITSSRPCRFSAR